MEALGTTVTAILLLCAISFLIRRIFLERLYNKHEGRVIAITGCDSGFGYDTATRLVNKGCTVIAGCYLEAILLFSDNSEHTLGSNFWDSMGNATLMICVIALSSTAMITLAIYKFKRIVESWLALSCIAVSFAIAGDLFSNAAAMLPVDAQIQLAISGSITAVYGSGSTMVFFSKQAPGWCHQLYVITNCACVSIFYLTCMPGNTAWYLLMAVVVWNIFAAVSPMGPLRIAMELPQEYSADILRFMMFRTDAVYQEEADSSSASPDASARPLVRGDAAGESSDSESDWSSDSSESDYELTIARTGEGKTAREALHTESLIGFGDFIFYSILVGKSMATGLIPALASTCGVLVGMMYTLSIQSDLETIPSLPVSIAFGMVGHVYAVAHVELAQVIVEYVF